MPAYRYTCNQTKDKKAITPMNNLWHPKTEHYFLVGNDRIVGLASNYGHLQVRQDEGAPKILNYFLPALFQYGGGFGYLSDGKETLSTFYDGINNNFERIFGIGYFRKKVKNSKYEINQLIYAPFGDDPIIISEVIISNNTSNPVDLKWFEYWGCFNYQYSFEAVMKAIQQKKVAVLNDHRILLGKLFQNRTFLLEKDFNLKGMINLKIRSKSNSLELQLDINEILKGNTKKIKRQSFEDKNPPPLFLVSLNNKVDSYINNAKSFFKNEGVSNPDNLDKSLSFESGFTEPENCMILVSSIHLEPNASTTLYFAYGYIPEGYDLGKLINKYKLDLEGLFIKSCESWKENRIKFSSENYSWIDRELFWHYYYLRGSMTYDNYFMEHILSQGHVYQYLIGFQGAARDPLQHALPFIYIQPSIVKEIIRYTFKEVQDDGEIPYGITGSGMIMPSPWHPSDLELWLLWLLSEYILSTKDLSILDEEISKFSVHGRKANNSTIREMMFLVYKHFIEKIGKGKHGLQRIADGDWNDMVITGFVPKDQEEIVRKYGESVLNSAMAVYVLSIFSEMLDLIGEKTIIKNVMDYISELRKATLEQWNGKWFRRAWLSEDLGWVGDDILWLEPQPWTIIGEIIKKEKIHEFVKTLDKMVRKPSQIGAMLHNKPISNFYNPPGVGTNAGIWHSINGTLIWALSMIDGKMAFDEWIKNSLAYKAEMYPEIWYIIWSGPDTLNSTFSKYPGHTMCDQYYFTLKPEDHDEGLKLIDINWTDFPVLNLHPHAWPQFNIFHLIGLRFNKKGVEFTPNLPEKIYSLKSPIIGFEKLHNGYSGWYLPLREGIWTISIKLNDLELKTIKTVIVNGNTNEYAIIKNSVIFEGKGGYDNPLTWKIEID